MLSYNDTVYFHYNFIFYSLQMIVYQINMHKLDVTNNAKVRFNLGG